MTLRATFAGLVLALAVAAAAPQAFAATFAVDLTLSYFSPAEPPPDPDFQGSFLTGQAQFFSQVISTFNTPLVPPGPPIDIGRRGRRQPHDPFPATRSLFRRRWPQSVLLPGGAVIGAEACPLGPPDVNACPPGPPIDNLNLLPAVQFGVFDANGPPVVQSGPIFAFDAPCRWATGRPP